MRSKTLGMLLLLAGCAEEPASRLAADASPLPQAITLDGPAAAYPGELAVFTLSGLTPNANVTLVGSNGEVGPGSCPPSLGGACVDITPGTSGYRRLATIPASVNGTAAWATLLPAGVPAGQWVFQAAQASTGLGSNPITVGVMCPRSTTTGTNPTLVDCTATSACQGSTITCPDGEDCTVQCGGISACQFAEVHCPNGGSCDVQCTNTSTCQFLQVFGGDADVSLTCTGLSACQVGELTCGDGNCAADCDPSMSASLSVIDGATACAVAEGDCL